jgi:hypothetical protein
MWKGLQNNVGVDNTHTYSPNRSENTSIGNNGYKHRLF